MTKVYKINGRRIESLWSDCSHKDLWMQVDQLLEALDEKKEEKIREPEGKQVSYPRDEKREKMAQDANYKNMPEYGEFWRNVKRSSIEEPKSTLRDKISYEITYAHGGSAVVDKTVDEIISLFKDTLLKEVKKAEPLRIPGESLEFTSGQEWTMRQIKQIIKNL